jgi:hypothetical protein
MVINDDVQDNPVLLSFWLTLFIIVASAAARLH